MRSDRTAGKKEGRLARHIRVGRRIYQEPRAIVPLLRGWLLGLWQARGGGFYGLGYVLTFIGMEIRTFTGEIGGSDSVSEFVLQQTFEFVSRICIDSFVNVFLALLWPAFLLEWLGGWGILVLLVGYFGFEHGIRPLAESWLPELREARILRERQKQEKHEKKRLKRARKGQPST